MPQCQIQTSNRKVGNAHKFSGQRIVFAIAGDAFCVAKTHPTLELPTLELPTLELPQR